MTTYYVAKNGKDTNPGTEAAPWLTIQKAANTLVAGDTVYIKEGTYNERFLPKKSGTPGNYITYAAYPGHSVTLDGTGIDIPYDYGGIIHIRGTLTNWISYIKVSGLKVTKSEAMGIFLQYASHIIIENCITYDTVKPGLAAYSCDNIIFDGNEVELACNGGMGECLKMHRVNIFEFRNNHVHHGGLGPGGGEGLAIAAATNGKIYNNRVDHINRIGMYIDAYSEDIRNVDIYQNIIHSGNQTGLAVANESNKVVENVNIYNNIIYNNQYNGIELASWKDDPALPAPLKTIKVINNTVYNNGHGALYDWGGIYVSNPEVENIIIRNNIISENVHWQIKIRSTVPTNAVTIDHNLIDGFRNHPEEVYGDTHIEGNPKFVNPALADFHLQEDSPAKDNGSSVDAPLVDFDGITRPQGAGIDIGAFEFYIPVEPIPPWWEEYQKEIILGIIVGIMLGVLEKLYIRK